MDRWIGKYVDKERKWERERERERLCVRDFVRMFVCDRRFKLQKGFFTPKNWHYVREEGETRLAELEGRKVFIEAVY